MVQRFKTLIRGLSSHWIGTAGVALTTSSFLIFVFLELLRLLGILNNTYIGLITYLVVPALFTLGLLLIPIGWWRIKKRTGLSTSELLQRKFTPEFVEKRGVGSRLSLTIATLTLLNLLFLGGGSARMLQFMDQPVFCGTACHSVMGPEWAVYQESPHARVRCVDCHVGDSADALLDSKINGMWQMVSVTFDLFERPIPTPVHNLRPARETCEKCHWPSKFYGQRIKRLVRYQLDEPSTPLYTTLALKVGSGQGDKRGEIHWHVAASNQVRYQADPKRQHMFWVEVKRPDGSFHRYTNKKASLLQQEKEQRLLDCVDCHNRATHVYESPEDAIDTRLARGEIDPQVPFIKRQALAALSGSYANNSAAMAGINNELWGFYRRHLGSKSVRWQKEIDQAVVTLQQIYQRHIHPSMNVYWNVYPDHRGHRNETGCFRCHNSDLKDQQGASISADCTLCHSVLAYDSERSFQYLEPVSPRQPDAKMHHHFRQEFLGEPQDITWFVPLDTAPGLPAVDSTPSQVSAEAATSRTQPTK